MYQNGSLHVKCNPQMRFNCILVLFLLYVHVYCLRRKGVFISYVCLVCCICGNTVSNRVHLSGKVSYISLVHNNKTNNQA